MAKNDKRIPIKKGAVIHLTSETGREILYEIQELVSNGDHGGSCFCYVAKRMQTEDPPFVILKEFYPVVAESFIQRSDNNSTNISELLDTPGPARTNLRLKLDSFKKSALYLKKYSEYAPLSENICNSDNPEILSGNGTFYYENEYLPGAESWSYHKNKNDTKEDELVQTAIGCIRFLKKMHQYPNPSGAGDALVDFKPEDILIPPAGDSNIPNFESPLFYDFGGVLEMNRTYPSGQIFETSPEYRPMIFNEEEAQINRKTENYTFSKMLNELLLKSDREKYLKNETKEKLIRLIRTTTDERLNTDVTEDEIEKTLTEIRDEIRNEEHEYQKSKFPRRKKLYYFVLGLLLILSICFHLFTGGVLVGLCFFPGAANQLMANYKIGIEPVLLLLCAVAILLVLLKLAVFFYSQFIAQTETSTVYYDKKDSDGKRVTTGEFNTFRYHFTRKSTTFQDLSDSNKKRQQFRGRSGFIAGVATALFLILSILLHSFPVLLAAVLVIITVFMYVENSYAMIDHYNRSVPKEFQNKSFREKRAKHYYSEYLESTDRNHEKPYDLSADYYRNHYRDIYHIRKKLMHAEQKVDLEFNPLAIQNIYKMTFDRARNTNLVLTLSVFAASVFTILMVFMSFTGIFRDYFMLPPLMYRIFIPFLILVSTGISLYQIFTAYHTEKTVAEVSYKSRYIMDFALNDMLVEDIINNTVKPIDITRGVHQYNGILHSPKRNKKNKVSRISNRSNTDLLKEQKSYNKELLHYDIMSEQRRCDLTVRMISCAVISIVVWHFGLYYLLIPILLFAIAIRILFKKVWIPKYTTKIITQDIEKYLK